MRITNAFEWNVSIILYQLTVERLITCDRHKLNLFIGSRLLWLIISNTFKENYYYLFSHYYIIKIIIKLFVQILVFITSLFAMLNYQINMLKQIVHCLDFLLIKFKFLITFYVIIYFRNLKNWRI